MYKRLFSLILVFAIFVCSFQGFAETQNKNLSLEEVLQWTLGQNPELQAMQKDADAVKAKVPQARSWEDPQVGVRFYQVPFSGGLGSAMDIDYIVSQKIPFPGKKKAASEIVYHDYLHHLENLNASQRALLKEAKLTYYSLFSVSKQIGQSRQVEKLLKSLVQSSQSKLITGESNSTEALQGQTDLAKLLIERESLFERERSLKAKLNQLMARPMNTPVNLPGKLETPSWNIKLEKLLEVAQVRHPSIKLARHNVGQKEWGVKAAKREYLPDLNAQLEYVQRPGPSENAWTGEFMINIPLLVKKKSKGVQQAQAELASAHYSESAAKNNILYQLQETFSKMKAAERILQINQKTLLPQTKQALEASAFSYSAGKSSFLSYLTSTRSYLDAQLDYWKAYEAIANSIFELEEAAGITQEEWASLSSSKIPLPLPSPLHREEETKIPTQKKE